MSRVPSVTAGEIWFALAFAVSAVGLPLLYLDQPLHFDEGIFLTVGRQLSTGAQLYADIGDHKPPGVFVVAATVYKSPGHPVTVARGLTYAVTAVSGLLVVQLGRQFCTRRRSYAAGVLFVVMTYLPHFDGYYFMTEPYAVLTMLGAAVLLGVDTPIANVAAGVALAVGVLFNQTVFLFGATILLFRTVKLRYPENRTREYALASVSQVLAIGIGFLATVAAVFAVLDARGLLAETLYYSLVVPLTNYSTPFDLWGHLLALGSLLPVWLLAGWMVVLTLAATARGDEVDDRLLFVALWTGVLSVPGAKAFSGDHKFLFAFPAIALLTITGAAKLYAQTLRNRDQFRRVPGTLPDRTALVTGILALAVVSATLVAGSGNVYMGSKVLEKDIGDDRAELNHAVEGLDGPIYGYNVLAGLYVHTDTEPGTTYLGTIYSDRIAHSKIADLERGEVPYVLVRDHFVSNGNIVASGYWADHKATMTAYLDEHYEPIRHRDGYVVFKRTETARGRNDDSPPEPAAAKQPARTVACSGAERRHGALQRG